MASRNYNDDEDEELGAYIYQTSHTAKLFREKAAVEEALVVASSSHQTRTKSARLLATKSKQQDIPTAVVPETSTNNTHGSRTSKQRTTGKRKLVLKEESCTPSRKQKKGEKYACGRERKLCSFEGCTNLARNDGVCIRHGAKVRRCKHDGCTNQVVRGGVCKRHGAKVKGCKHKGCNNLARNYGVCYRHGAKKYICSYKGCNNQAQNGRLCIRHGAKVKRCRHEECNKQARNGGVCRRHGAKKYMQL